MKQITSMDFWFIGLKTKHLLLENPSRCQQTSVFIAFQSNLKNKNNKNIELLFISTSEENINK